MKQRALESLRANNEFVQHVLLGIALAHSGLMKSAQQIHVKYSNGILDLTEYAQVFLKDPQNEKRLTQTMTRILVDGVVKAHEASRAYFEQLGMWKRKQWEDLYLVSGLIRVTGSHNLVWRYNRKLMSQLGNMERSFPLKYGGLKIEESWKNQKAKIEHLPNIDVIFLIKSIHDDVEKC